MARKTAKKPDLSKLTFADLSAYRIETLNRMNDHSIERNLAALDNNEPRANTQFSQFRLLQLSYQLVCIEISKRLEETFDILPFKAVG